MPPLPQEPDNQFAAAGRLTALAIGWGSVGKGSRSKGGIAAVRFHARALTDTGLGAEFARTKGQFGLWSACRRPG